MGLSRFFLQGQQNTRHDPTSLCHTCKTVWDSGMHVRHVSTRVVTGRYSEQLGLRANGGFVTFSVGVIVLVTLIDALWVVDTEEKESGYHSTLTSQHFMGRLR